MESNGENTNVQNPFTLGTLVGKQMNVFKTPSMKESDNLQPVSKFILKPIYQNIITHFKVCIFII